MSSQKRKRKLVRYTYTVEEESFCSNGSDSESDYSSTKATDYETDSDLTAQTRKQSKSVKHTHGRRLPLKNTRNLTADSPSSQDSLTDRLKQPVERKRSKKSVPKNAKNILREVIETSRSQRMPDADDRNSDSSLIFTDEISEASASLKEHHESFSKSVLLKKSETCQKEIKVKAGKRKDLSASRKASKKIKLNDTDDVELVQDPIECITIESDNFSEFDTTLTPKSNKKTAVPICKTEKCSPVKVCKIKKEKDHDAIPLKASKRKKIKQESSEEGPSSTQISSLMSIPAVKIKSESVDPAIDVCKIKTEKKDEKLISKKKLKQISTVHASIKVENGKKTEQTKTNEAIEKTRKAQPAQGKFGTGPEWESHMVAELMELDFHIAKNIVTLFESDCTIPFIARYRRENTNNMDADQLRQVKNAYEYVKSLQKRAILILKKLEAAGKLTKSLENSIHHVKSIEELEFIYAPFKEKGGESKAKKARSLGLQEAASNVLHGNGGFNPSQYVIAEKDGVKNPEDVIQSVQHIMAEMFSKDEAVLEFIQNIEHQIPITVKSTLKKDGESNDKEGKLRIYYDFTKYVRDLLPHQILALNRGESLKIITVKMQIDESFCEKLYRFCCNRWLRFGKSYPLREKMFDDSFKDSYSRLISPLLTRRTKAKLTRKAQETAVENFALNLKNLLQTPPVKGCSILGIDPGLRHGVKFALISSHGEVLWTCILGFDLKDPDSQRNSQNMVTIKRNMVQNRCELIAIGNGCGSREIETVISNHLKRGFFNPELNVSYTFVNERGASIYSCSSVAKEEFPDLDPNLISAVFIARTLQDPLSEFVKVEPKHLGVGMYQHDIPDVKLNNSLDEVVMQVVSFAGIDVNTASIYLLKRVAGLGATRAANIIKWRQENGPFKNRQQLTKVKSLGPITFEQCSGFLRIHPQTCNVQEDDLRRRGIPGVDDYNPLDSTWIHPESYNIAYLFIGHCNSNVSDIGTPKFINKLNKVVQQRGLKSIAEILGQSEFTISSIYDALTKPSNYDYRFEFSKPVFSKGLSSIDNLNVDDIMQGVVTNVVAFGAFIDIGVGKSGLVHITNMNRIRVQVGDRVEVKILNMEKSTGRISLFLMNKI